MNKRIKKKHGKIQDNEIWDLDDTLARYILPRLKRFRQIKTNSYPSRLSGLEEWYQIIDKMIYSFNKCIEDEWDYSNLEEENRIYQEGMNLFAEYFRDLWD